MVEREGLGGVLSFDDVQGALVDAFLLQKRTEGGRWPFASDGPWNLIRKEWSDWDARDPKPMPRIPLSAREMARLSEVMGWMTLVSDDLGRRLIVLAVTELAKGARRVPWVRVRRLAGLDIEPWSVACRYRKALGEMTRRVNIARRAA